MECPIYFTKTKKKQENRLFVNKRWNGDGQPYNKTLRKGMCIQTLTTVSKAHDLARFAVKDGLRGVRDTANVKSRPNMPNYSTNLRKTAHFFIVRPRTEIKLLKMVNEKTLKHQRSTFT